MNKERSTRITKIQHHQFTMEINSDSRQLANHFLRKKPLDYSSSVLLGYNKMKVKSRIKETKTAEVLKINKILIYLITNSKNLLKYLKILQHVRLISLLREQHT